MINDIMRFRFTLKSMLIVFALTSVVGGVCRYAFVSTPVMTIVAEPADCLIYLDDVPLGSGRVTLTAEQAVSLRMPLTVSGQMQFDIFPHGAMLQNTQDAAGRMPLLHLRPPQNGPYNYPLVSLAADRRGDAIQLRDGLYHPDERKLKLTAETSLPTEPIVNAITWTHQECDNNTHTVQFRAAIPAEIREAANALNGGLMLYLSAVSLHDGRIIAKQWDLPPDESTEQVLVMEFPTRAANENFVFYAYITARDESLLRALAPVYGHLLPVRKYVP